MATLKPNQRVIDAIKPTDRRAHYSIDGTPGLQLDVTSMGAKTWRAYATDPNGKRRWKTIGPAHAIGVGRATDEARKFVEAATLGDLETTADDRPDTRATFANLFEKWHAYTAQHKKALSRAEDRRIFETTIKPRLGPLQLGFAPEDRLPIIAALDEIAKANSPIQANRAQAVISATLSFALDEGMVLLHPAVRIRKRGSERSRSRDLKPNEIKSIWDGVVTLDPQICDAVRLLMLLGQRRSEIVEANRLELDTDGANGAVLSIAAERRKSWRFDQAKTPHMVPLALASIAIIKARLKEARNSAYLFPKRTLAKEQPMSAANVSSRFAELMRSLKIADCHLHDLRHMVKTGMTSLGVPPDIADRVQDQATGRGSGKIYDRYEYLAEKRRALEIWEKRLLEIVAARPPSGLRW